MIKLIRAGFRRYARKPLFWITLGLSLLFGFVASQADINSSVPNKRVLGNFVQDVFFGNTTGRTFSGLITILYGISAVLLCFSIGREFSDHVIRNKLVCGHSKGKIYLSEWILAMLVTVLMQLSFCLGVVLDFLPVLDDISLPFFLYLLGGLTLAHLALATFFAVVALLVNQRAVVIALCLVVLLGSESVIHNIQSKLNCSEFVYDYATPPVVENGVVIEEGEMVATPNPRYVSGIRRKLYSYLVVALPSGPIREYDSVLSEMNRAVREPQNNDSFGYNEEALAVVKISPLYSIGAILVFGAVGYWIFRKKSIA